MSFFGSYFSLGSGGAGTPYPYPIISVEAVSVSASFFAETTTGPMTASAFLYDTPTGIRTMGNEIEVYSGNDWPIVALLKKANAPNTAPGAADVSTANRIGYALVHVQSKRQIIPLKLSLSTDLGADWENGLVACGFTRAETAAITEGNYSLEIVVEMPGDASTYQTTWARIPVAVKMSIAALP